MTTISRQTNRQFVNRLVKSKLFLFVFAVITVATLIYLFNQGYRNAIAIQKKEITRQELQRNIRDLADCFSVPDDRLCYPKLAIISNQLDLLPGTSREEAQIWGLTHSWLDSHANSKYPRLHDRTVKWALLDGYLVGEYPSTPEGVKLFRSELRSQFNKRVKLLDSNRR